MKVKKLLTNKGQTSVEYILMIVVVTSVSIGLFKQLEELIISNPDSLINSYLDSYKDAFGGQDGGFTGKFRFFKVNR